MPGGLATEIRHHPMRNGGGGFSCSQFYGTGSPSSLFQNLLKRSCCSTTANINVNIDETDNNTASNNNNSDLLQIGSLKPRYIMDDVFHREDERLKTFDNWPLDWLNKNELAMTGMFYMGEEDKCKCYFCEVEIGRWEREDQPMSEHLRWSPNCPLLRRRTTNNVPISPEALDSVLPAPSYDICGLNDTIEVRPQAITDEVRPSTAAASTSTVGSGSDCISSTTFYPEFPEYAIETARMRSFAEWPRHMKQKPKQLVEAGFFYTGVGDRVRCFSCGGGLKDWGENDNPWEEHAFWMSKCRFLKLMKGQNYIDAVLDKQNKKGKETEKLSKADSEDRETELGQETLAIPAANVQANGAAAAAPSILEEKPITKSINEMKVKFLSSIPEEKICKICYATEYNTTFLPCGHVVACAKCASSVTKCPVCRKPFTDVMRIYFS
uniref:RING-type domain-containing protein n=1 Tax=Glossina austeni TaxID=7395 RepID=A0A1A9VKX9_GLOAU